MDVFRARGLGGAPELAVIVVDVGARGVDDVVELEREPAGTLAFRALLLHAAAKRETHVRQVMPVLQVAGYKGGGGGGPALLWLSLETPVIYGGLTQVPYIKTW